MTGAPDLDVVGEAADGLEAVDLTRRLRPDVVLVDVRMPRMDGIAATRRITSFDRPPAVLVVTTFDLDQYVFEALRAGACGFLLNAVGLTGRERDVWTQLARGRSNAEIAATLFIGETTVTTHVSRLLMKLGAASRSQAVVMAYESGLVRPGEHDGDR